ncbi:prolipoprotein diacylglyceryl transferase [Desulfonatronospira thiodismutans ASO3-1]|uniref:Phosphatidylglycerol--prolipoprotein diacylglyceryl transferase n=1 Tax=Desulfonatronospira thiodismutans ASO3-1 TaxID=555779 RepID=D6SMT7_9BACT|nr:prolipoprotein diacylglyceryl transferase [Desulfonatronospira thiodismutans]EFI35998.1 prolipoprotein diacylglyceryl transferase [Desulfonatronospira thiodismutans ASO3-1]
MLQHPNFDPVAIAIGPLEIRWYGLMYLAGFTLAWLLARHRAKKPGSGWDVKELPDMVVFGALGIILGARLGYMLFYDFFGLISQPWTAVMIWQGGMSFHGGLIGGIIAMYWYARKTGRGFFTVTDFVAPMGALGVMCGRIGNFINAELWGRPTDVPWAMVFPGSDMVPRHPSQIYQALLEGLLLFIILWIFSSRPRPTMAVSGLFCLGYGVLRFLVEFFREPDAHLGFVLLDWMTMGQILSVPMIILGAVLLYLAYGFRGETR